MMKIQKYCEILEKLIDKEIKRNDSLTPEEFMALNFLLGEMQAKGYYKLKEEV